MEDLPKYYTVLFNATTKAIEAIDHMQFAAARKFLIRGQQEAETVYITANKTIPKP
jgi:hypothetical protein